MAKTSSDADGHGCARTGVSTINKISMHSDAATQCLLSHSCNELICLKRGDLRFKPIRLCRKCRSRSCGRSAGGTDRRPACGVDQGHVAKSKAVDAEHVDPEIEAVGFRYLYHRAQCRTVDSAVGHFEKSLILEAVHDASFLLPSFSKALQRGCTPPGDGPEA